jgi:asparagine synthase (glutamine-hydrolysing)
MCGFAGVARAEPRGVAPELVTRMAAAVRHRGPDGSGHYTDDRVGLAHVRLKVIDLAGGAQPMAYAPSSPDAADRKSVV